MFKKEEKKKAPRLKLINVTSQNGLPKVTCQEYGIDFHGEQLGLTAGEQNHRLKHCLQC